MSDEKPKTAAELVAAIHELIEETDPEHREPIVPVQALAGVLKQKLRLLAEDAGTGEDFGGNWSAGEAFYYTFLLELLAFLGDAARGLTEWGTGLKDAYERAQEAENARTDKGRRKRRVPREPAC